MGRTACTEPQCLYKGALYLFYTIEIYHKIVSTMKDLPKALEYSLCISLSVKFYLPLRILQLSYIITHLLICHLGEARH